MSEKKENNPIDDNYLYSASANDMTGLTPSVAHNEYEAQSYEEIYPYLPPLPPNSVITIPESPISECIQSNYRTKVTRQNKDEKR